MKKSSYPEITDELLSAYIDNAVSDAERALVEQAVREDTTVAWRLATLRETVNLLRAMPVLPAPRSFTLTAEQVGQPVRTPALVPGVIAADTPSAPAARPAKPSSQRGGWTAMLERWRGFWQAGSPVWRNAMAASMALLLVMVVVPAFLDSRGQSDQMAAAPMALVSDEPEAVTASQATASQATASQATALQATASPATVQEAVLTGETAVFSAPDAVVAAESAAPAEQAILPENQAESVSAMAMDDAVIAAAPPVQATALSGVRLITPSTRDDDPLNPQPPLEDTGGAGIAAAEMLPPAPALVAPMPELGLQSPPVALEEAPSAKALDAPEENEAASSDLTTLAGAPASTTAASEEIAPAPAAVAESIETAEAPADQQTVAEPTIVAYAPSASQAEARSEAAAPPAPAGAVVDLARLLPWLQLALLGAVLVFGLLWQRSRRSA